MPNADDLIELFNGAKARDPGQERESFLEEQCRDQPELREQVDSLLAACEVAGNFLRLPSVPRPDAFSVTEKPGDRIGRYKLLEQIGEGGCGVVYMAEQEEPVRRRVALKVIKLGMDTKSVIARFEAERQALAMMDHPNIAKVLDAGATEAGRPYFVMELVRGIKITDFCDQNSLSTEDRLKLFSQVCHAVQHAHQKGIIHRDIKPSNILVTVSEPGAPGCPRVIDFGIAKATSEQRLTDKTVFTAFEQFIGTPAYMSPEQAMMTSQDIDTRTDIYALGVLLYELLTGRTPFDARELAAAGLDAMRRIIGEQEPAKPSTRLNTMPAADLTTVARHRQAEPARLGTQLRGDLDWIVMKCLEKDRNRRYGSANDVAMDLQRHLSSEPVLACPPSVGYRFRKFARRNKAALAVAAVLALATVLTVGTLLISNRMITRERDDKEAALTNAVEEKARADRNLARAREAVKEYLLKTSENPLLKTGDFQGLKKELMETAIPFYEEFVKQDHTDPLLEFERGAAYDDLGFLREGMGESVRSLEDFEQAKKVFKNLGERYPDKPEYRRRRAEACNSRGAVLKDLSRIDEAEREFVEALEVVNLLLTSNGTSKQCRETLARINGNFGMLLKESGRLPEAEQRLGKAVEIREKLLEAEPDSFSLRGQLSTSLNNCGGVLEALRKRDEAARAFERALAVLDDDAVKITPRSPEAERAQHLRAQAWNSLGMIRKAQSRLGESEKAYRESLTIKEQLAERYPSIPQHRQELAATFNNLGTVVSSLKRPDEARTAYGKAIQLYEQLAAGAPDEPRYAVMMAGSCSNMGRLLGDEGKGEESLPWLKKAIEILEASLRRDARVAKVRSTLCIASWTRAMTLCGLERYDEALPDWDRAVEMDEGRYHNELRIKRASNLLNVKDHVRAAADGEAIAAATAVSADELYNVTCLFALCSQLAQEERSQADAYATRAVAVLRLAVKAGYKDTARIKTHPDLEALRSRGDFQQLIKESEAGPGK